jgi:hypothetical protein
LFSVSPNDPVSGFMPQGFKETLKNASCMVQPIRVRRMSALASRASANTGDFLSGEAPRAWSGPRVADPPAIALDRYDR